MNKFSYIVISICLAMFLPSVKAQKADTTKTKKAEEITAFQPIPRRAALLATFVPGAGQIYNRKYWKVPIVYAGYGALGYAIWVNNDYYQDYKTAYASYIDDDPNSNAWMKYVPAGLDPNTIDPTWFANALNNKQLQYRRWRDLSIIGIVAFYGLTILDAYVDAQLYDFDISPNLSLHVEPTFEPTMITGGKPNIGLRCQFTF